MDIVELIEEKNLLTALREKDMKAYVRFCVKYRDDLILFTFCQVNNITLATQIVDKLFESLWIDEHFHLIEPPIYKFLVNEIRKAVR